MDPSRLDYDRLATEAFAWHSMAGNVHGILLDRKRPALALCSYKFFLAQALEFDLTCRGQSCAVLDVRLQWLPHAVSATYRYREGELTLEALFTQPEVVALRVRVRASGDGTPLNLALRGIARNGRDKDGFFDFAGQPAIAEGLAWVAQRIDIPDYFSQPSGPLRRHPHHLAWLVDPGQSASLADDAVRTEDPFYEGGANLSAAWTSSLAQEVADFAGVVRFAVRWLGPAVPCSLDRADLRGMLEAARREDFDGELALRRAGYEALLERLPLPKPRYRGNAPYLRLYAHAWVCIWQNIAGSLETVRKTLPAPSAFVSKVAPNGFGPAQWETSLAGYLASFIDPDVGIGIIESVLACVEDDGFLPEDLIFNRDVKLASLEPTMLEEIARRTGRKDFLERTYDRLYRQLLFHLKHPGFHYLSAAGCHLAAENTLSLRALERIARVLGKPPAHLRELRWLREDAEAALDAALAREPGVTFDVLDGYLDERAARELVARIERHHLPGAGRFFLHRHPDGVSAKTGEPDLDACKMVFFLHFIPGLERLGADDLLDRLAESTFRGLEKAGDFWECYTVEALPWGNGPMSIFGAFGWIWLLMDKGRDY